MSIEGVEDVQQFNIEIIEEHLNSLSVEEIEKELSILTGVYYSDNKQELINQLLGEMNNNVEFTETYATEIKNYVFGFVN